MLSRPFLVLALAMFSATLGIGMVTPILPVHAKSLGASGAAVGLTFSAFAITQVFISPFSGRLADRYGRKPFLVAGLATYVIAALGWWLTSSLVLAIAFRAFSGVGSAMIFSLARAYIGDLAPEGHEGRYMGTFGIFDFLGFGAGPLLAGIIRDQTDLRTTFLAMALLFTLSSAVVALLLPRQAQRAGSTAAPRPVTIVAPWATILRDAYVQALYALRVSFSFSIGASFSFIALYLEEQLLATATMVGALLAAQQITNGVMQPVVGWLADRLGRRGLVTAGAALVAGGYGTVWATESYGAILAGFIVGVGVGGALLNVAAQAVQVDVGRRLGMATVMGLESMAFATGILLGSLGGGLIAEGTSVASVFLAASVALAIGTAFFLGRTARIRPAPASPRATIDEPAPGA